MAVRWPIFRPGRGSVLPYRWSLTSGNLKRAAQFGSPSTHRSPSRLAIAAGRSSSGDPSVSVSASCPTITVELKHTGSLPVAAMGHNVVITETASVNDVAQAGIKAGAPAYLPEGDARVIAATDMIGGGQSTSVTHSSA